MLSPPHVCLESIRSPAETFDEIRSGSRRDPDARPKNPINDVSRG
jgi:hypothetical protein